VAVLKSLHLPAVIATGLERIRTDKLHELFNPICGTSDEPYPPADLSRLTVLGFSFLDEDTAEPAWVSPTIQYLRGVIPYIDSSGAGYASVLRPVTADFADLKQIGAKEGLAALALAILELTNSATPLIEPRREAPRDLWEEIARFAGSKVLKMGSETVASAASATQLIHQEFIKPLIEQATANPDKTKAGDQMYLAMLRSDLLARLFQQPVRPTQVQRDQPVEGVDPHLQQLIDRKKEIERVEKLSQGLDLDRFRETSRRR
jgi:hypothetical protein